MERWWLVIAYTCMASAVNDCECSPDLIKWSDPGLFLLYPPVILTGFAHALKFLEFQNKKFKTVKVLENCSRCRKVLEICFQFYPTKFLKSMSRKSVHSILWASDVTLYWFDFAPLGVLEKWKNVSLKGLERSLNFGSKKVYEPCLEIRIWESHYYDTVILTCVCSHPGQGIFKSLTFGTERSRTPMFSCAPTVYKLSTLPNTPPPLPTKQSPVSCDSSVGTSRFNCRLPLLTNNPTDFAPLPATLNPLFTARILWIFKLYNFQTSVIKIPMRV